jgi:hypothetical protein
VVEADKEEKEVRFSKSKSVFTTLVAAAGSAVGAGVAVAVGLFTISPLLYFPAGGGNLSPYLVGFYEQFKSEAELYLVNPTPLTLEAFVVLFDDDENPVACHRATLTPNDFEDIEISEMVCQKSPVDLDEGVIKVVSFKPNPNNSSIRTLQTGLVGWVRHEGREVVALEDGNSGGIADTQLASVPLEVLTAQANYELKLIEAYVLEHCSPD